MQMPFVNVRTVKGLLNEQQKKELMNRLSDALVEIEGGGSPEFRKLIWILIEENEPTQWQIGELQPTTEYIAAVVQRRDAK
jgi:4-oxalocrotonate tautomerase